MTKEEVIYRWINTSYYSSEIYMGDLREGFYLRGVPTKNGIEIPLLLKKRMPTENISIDYNTSWEFIQYKLYNIDEKNSPIRMLSRNCNGESNYFLYDNKRYKILPGIILEDDFPLILATNITNRDHTAERILRVSKWVLFRKSKFCKFITKTLIPVFADGGDSYKVIIDDIPDFYRPARSTEIRTEEDYESFTSSCKDKLISNISFINDEIDFYRYLYQNDNSPSAE